MRYRVFESDVIFTETIGRQAVLLQTRKFECILPAVRTQCNQEPVSEERYRHNFILRQQFLWCADMGGFLDGKLAVITGSTSGIGLGYARSLAAEGCSILLNGFGDAKEIEQTRASIEADFKVRALYNEADMRKPPEINSMIATADQEFGKIDILINNAGMQYRSPVEEFPLDIWNEMFAVNVTSAMLTTQLVLPQMRDRNWGRIINTASVNSMVTSPNTSAYTASKHAVMGLTRAVALETIMTGVTCNAICPGTVRTNLSEHRIETFAAEQQKSTDDVIDEYLEQKMPYHQAMKRFITVEEVAAAAVYLCSDAGAAMRGAAFTIDGGWTIR